MIGGEVAQDLCKAAEIIADQELDHDSLMKYAADLAQIDETSGFTHLYGHSLSFPEDVMFAVDAATVKSALADTIELANGQLLNSDQVEQLPWAKISEALGDSLTDAIGGPTIINDVQQLKQALTKLSEEDADIVCLFVPNKSSALQGLAALC